MEFKEPKRMQHEYYGLPLKMRKILIFCEEFFQHTGKGPLFITSIFRTMEEQEEICRIQGIPFKPSVHQFYRGVDVRTHRLSDLERQWLVYFINYKFPYDKDRPQMKTAICHEGTGMHLHLQVKA